MKKVLRGNDVIINWTVKQLIKDVATVVDFTGKSIRLYICDAYGNRPAEFTIVDGIIKIHLGGNDQNNGVVNLDCYWQDITSFVCNRTKINDAIEFVDNPSLVDLDAETADIDVLTVNFTSEAFFGGIYNADFSNYYTKAEVDAKYGNDYNKLINKPFSIIDNVVVSELPVLIKNNIVIGNYVLNTSGAIVTKSGVAEIESLTVRKDVHVKGKIYINGIEVGTGSAPINTEVLDGRYVLKTVWDSMFEVDVDGKLKIKVDAYTIGGFTALGQSSSSSSGNGIDYEALNLLLTDDANAYQINSAFLTAIDKPYIIDKLGNQYANYNHTHSISSLANDSGYITSAALVNYATQGYVTTKFNELLNGAPAAFDTLKEIADVLQTNVNSIGDLVTALGSKWTQDNSKITNWDTAFSWGNHATSGYLNASVFNDIFEIVTDDNGVKTLKIKGNAYVELGLSALGNSLSSGTGTFFDIYNNWSDAPDQNAVLSSELAKPLYDQVQQLESDLAGLESNVGSKTLGGLSNVDDTADTAKDGTVLVNENSVWKIKLYDHIRRAITDIDNVIIEDRESYLLRVNSTFRYQGLSVVLKKVVDTVTKYVEYRFIGGIADSDFNEFETVQIVNNFTEGGVNKAASAESIKTLYGLVMNIDAGTL